MSNISKTGWITVLSFLLSACASMQPTGYSYNEVVIINKTRAQVHDVSIAATESGRVFSCGNIAPRGICSNQFPPQPYRASPIRISWMIGSGTRHSKIIELGVPESFEPGIQMRGVLLIDARGQIDAYLQQPTPVPEL